MGSRGHRLHGDLHTAFWLFVSRRLRSFLIAFAFSDSVLRTKNVPPASLVRRGVRFALEAVTSLKRSGRPTASGI